MALTDKQIGIYNNLMADSREPDKLFLMECTEIATGKKRALICTEIEIKGETYYQGLAVICDGDTFNEYMPPTATKN